MPSSKFIDLTWGSSVTYYTAPAAGYFRVRAFCNASGFVYMSNTANDIRARMQTPYNADREIFVPVLQGQQVVLVYENLNDSAPSIRFIYAEGAK